MIPMKKGMLALAIGMAIGDARALPTGPSTAAGAALISNPSSSVLQVVNTPGAILNWQGFSIAAGETARFVQANAASAVLNRVIGANPSSILGRLESNGRVFLINPNGIVFGAGAVVDVAGLIASTRDIANSDFLAGNLRFSGTGNGDITVRSGAQILTSTYGPGGQVWLFAKNVTQEAGSSITAPQGQVVLAAGSELQVASNNLGQMTFSLATAGTNTVDSLGTIAADRGAVGLFADFINHRGTINAGEQGSVDMNATADLHIKDGSSIQAPDGKVTLRGGRELEVEPDATINADGPSGRISFESNNLLVYPSGNIHAVGGEVTFLQYQPSAYVPGTPQNPWTTPAGFADDNPIVFRGTDGSMVVRFQRRNNSTGDDVGVFEVALDGRTGALRSGPTLLAASSAAAAAYNAARRITQNATSTYNAAIAAAQAAYNSTFDRLVADEQAGFDRASVLAATQIDANPNSNGFTVATVNGLIAGRDNSIAALRADAEARPAAYAYPFTLAFQINQSINFYRGLMFDAVRLAVYESRLASANVMAGMEGSVQYVTEYSNELSRLRTEYNLGLNQAQSALGAAQAAAQSAYSAAANAAPGQILAARAGYNAALVSGTSSFLSDGDADLRGVPTSVRIPTAGGGAIVALRRTDQVVTEYGEDGPYTYTDYGGRGAGSEIRTGAGALVATVGSGNVVPMTDGTYLVNQGGGYDLYKPDGTYLRSDSQFYGGILAPLRSGGFMTITAYGEQVVYAKSVPAYTRLNNLSGVAGPVASVLTRPGVAPDGDATLPNVPTPPAPVVRGNPNGGSDFGGVSGCNASVCEQALREAQAAAATARASTPPDPGGTMERASTPAGNGKAVERTPERDPTARDVGTMTEREYLDALIAADKAGKGSKIDEQDAAIAVQALARAARKQSEGTASFATASSATFALQDNGELRQLVFGWGDLGSMTPERRMEVFELWMQQLTTTQTEGALGRELTNTTISVKDIAQNIQTPEEKRALMDYAAAARKQFEEAEVAPPK